MDFNMRERTISCSARLMNSSHTFLSPYLCGFVRFIVSRTNCLLHPFEIERSYSTNFEAKRSNDSELSRSGRHRVSVAVLETTKVGLYFSTHLRLYLFMTRCRYEDSHFPVSYLCHSPVTIPKKIKRPFLVQKY